MCITLCVKMWIFSMFGFVAQNKYPPTPLWKQAPVSTLQLVILFTELGIPASTKYMYNVFRRFLTSACQFCFSVLHIG